MEDKEKEATPDGVGMISTSWDVFNGLSGDTLSDSSRLVKPVLKTRKKLS